MIKNFILLFSFCNSILSAQIFNKSIVFHGNEGTSAVMRSSEATFLALSTAEHAGMTNTLFRNISLEEEFLESKFRIFPNPVSDILNLKTNEPFIGTLHIYNVSGQLVKEQSIAIDSGESIILNVQNLPPGVYIVKAVAEETTMDFRFIKR